MGECVWGAIQSRIFSSATHGGNWKQRLLRCRHKMHSYVTSTRRNEEIPLKSKDEAENSAAEAASNRTKVYLRSSYPYLDAVFCRPPVACIQCRRQNSSQLHRASHHIQLLHRLSNNGSPSNGAFIFTCGSFILSMSIGFGPVPSSFTWMQIAFYLNFLSTENRRRRNRNGFILCCRWRCCTCIFPHRHPFIHSCFTSLFIRSAVFSLSLLLP